MGAELVMGGKKRLVHALIANRKGNMKQKAWTEE